VKKPYRKILIANRGEIAVRIIRACREQGITAATIYSAADRESLHVRVADEAYCIGDAAAAESYLAGGKIVALAKEIGAEAIHPGYGFLAENAAFAERCEREGVAFIGPPSSAIARMGDKALARKIMKEAGIAVIPGSDSLSGSGDLKREAKKLGYPVIIKAAAGGGGKGMRLVYQEEGLEAAYREARHEAKSFFADDRVYLEKYFLRPRHVEMQILGDKEGNIVYLGERECTLQRRHQKVVEEAPSVVLSPEMRKRMGRVAVEAARAAGYFNAGTVEFLVDSGNRFYFMEMNTRLQVEHPVTELTCGLDLVKEQFSISRGEPLRYRQRDLRVFGAAIECRIYAEDPEKDFLPSPGVLRIHQRPGGPGVRVDEGVYDGYEVPIDYDPLITKVITWGTDREEARRRMARALGEYSIGGIKTTIPFLKQIVESETFASGDFHTGTLAEISRKLAAESAAAIDPLPAVIAGALSYHEKAKKKYRTTAPVQTGWNAWKMSGRLAQMRK
jgi:acetyl-CoA carboxylase biotin carboxylase subunit